MPRKPYSITNKMVKQMREARERGCTYQRIADVFGISVTTVARYVNEAARQKQLKYERDRYYRIYSNTKENAEAIEKKRARVREYLRNLRGNNEKSNA